MKEIIERLEERKEVLKKVPFFNFLNNKELSPNARLSFAPSMLFFTMGFKDILHTLEDESNPSPLQQSVNTHCQEDSFHWEWYLKDLERISYGKDFLNLPQTTAFTNIWSEEYRAVREVVYHCIHLAKTYTAPFHRLIIIEALEATFECFNEPVYEMVQEIGKQDELEYFGQTHYHSEANHAMDKATQEQESAAYHGYQPDTVESRISLFIIDEVFNGFESVFTCWHRHALAVLN